MQKDEPTIHSLVREDPRLDRMIELIGDAAHEAPDEPVTWAQLHRVMEAGIAPP